MIIAICTNTFRLNNTTCRLKHPIPTKRSSPCQVGRSGNIGISNLRELPNQLSTRFASSHMTTIEQDIACFAQSSTDLRQSLAVLHHIGIIQRHTAQIDLTRSTMRVEMNGAQFRIICCNRCHLRECIAICVDNMHICLCRKAVCEVLIIRNIA